MIHGPDYNRRHEHPACLPGPLPISAMSSSEFRWMETASRCGTDQGHFIEEEVFIAIPLNPPRTTASPIPALKTVDVRYDVDVPTGIEGPLQINVRLRARAFPPRFLRALAAGRPDLVNEKMVDRKQDC